MFQKEDVKDLDKSQKNHMQNKKLKKERGNPSSKAVPSRKKQPQVGNSGAATKQEILVSDESEEDSMEASEDSEDRHKESVSLKGKSKMKEDVCFKKKMPRRLDQKSTRESMEETAVDSKMEEATEPPGKPDSDLFEPSLPLF
ncbi:hypothetical protein CCACVL1_26273 [Corchorus capsularis]|uniref:Uncharacterized protein n=1 Tax=Corchorus capsularis TaxID=210143 RepID=A0A1R3GFA5_COCAP|nr:hypothetical protein CCACVL1_26273 [Corchorus capsularis]